MKPKNIKTRWVRFIVIGALLPFAVLITLTVELLAFTSISTRAFFREIRDEYSSSHTIRIINGDYFKQVWKTMIKK